MIAATNTEPSDLRRFTRVEFFLIPAEREQLPVWVFKPALHAGDVGGVVINISEGGLQILTHDDEALHSDRFDLRLLLGEAENVELFNGPVVRLWSQAMTKLGQVHGFRFEEPNSLAEEFLNTQVNNVAERQWVRCVLVRREALPSPAGGPTLN